MAKKSNQINQGNYMYYYSKHDEDAVESLRTKLRRKKRERCIKTAALVIIIAVIAYFVFLNFK